MEISITTRSMREAQQKHSSKKRNRVLAQNPAAELHPTVFLILHANNEVTCYLGGKLFRE